MARARKGKGLGSSYEPKPHELAVIRIKNIALEMGYLILKCQVTPGVGIDLEIKNPKNERIAIVEIELSYASQIRNREKLGKRWNDIKVRLGNGEDVVFLIFGISREILLRDFSRAPASVPDACKEYGKSVFSVPAAEESYQIQIALLRCLE